MNSFTYYSPTRVIFGAKTTDQAGAAVKAHGGTNVLVLYGGGSALRNGVLDRVTKSLEAAGLSYECVGGIQPNPRLSFAQKLVDKYQGKGFDFLLAVGGGSVIDTMKGVSMGLACGSPIWDFYEGKRTLTAAIPMGSVLTIAAAGSETSASSVLTNEEGPGADLYPSRLPDRLRRHRYYDAHSGSVLLRQRHGLSDRRHR